MSELEKVMVIFQPSGRRGYVDKGKNLKEASVALGVDIEGICGEKAVCGKCKIRIEEGLFEKYGVESHRENISPMTDTERKFFNLKQELDGYRLACQAKIKGEVVVFVPEESRLGKQVVRKAAKEIEIELKPAVKKYYVEMPKATLEDTMGDWERLTQTLNEKHGLTRLSIDYQTLMTLQDSIRSGEWKVTVTVWMGKEVIKIEPGKKTKSYGLAVDVGSTTVAGYLCELSTGKLIATASMMNPQVIYGEDVMSRITYTMTNPDGLTELNQAIIDGLNGIITSVSRGADIEPHDIVDMTIVGNTCMHHLYLNINPLYIGKAPFPPALHHSIDLKARDWGLKIAPIKTSELGSDPPCQVACPAKVNCQDFLYLIAQGKYDESLEMIRRAMPFAGVLGRVCTHPCETECERGKVEEPISIRSAHRFVADEELKKGHKPTSQNLKTRDLSVAIVGSGPAGLSCAYELVKKGYGITVFEAAEKAGGLLRYGIPDYRLPKSILDEEISYIQSLGVDIKCNSPVTSLESLLDNDYKAVFVAIGAGRSQNLGIPSENAAGVAQALDFLKAVNNGGKVELGSRVVVIGGGNAAVDAARAAKRLGAKEVSIVYRRSREEMPAIASEINAAEEEGINLLLLATPIEVLTADGKTSGVKCVKNELGEEDESGRRRPFPIRGSEFYIATDNVIIAIGQTVNHDGIDGALEFDDKGSIKADRDTLATTMEGVFAGGDATSGPADVVSAVEAGQEAAISIELYLEGVDLKEGRPKALKKVEGVPKEGVEKEARQENPELPPEKRLNFNEVELSFSYEAAESEAKRCLHCSVYAEKEEKVIEARGVGLEISPGAYVHCLPIEAGFVGADNVGVLIAEEPYKQDSIELIIDIGTNGELVLGNRHKLVSASCATGPALEGAEIKFGMRAAPGAIEKIVIDPETKEVRFRVIEQEAWSDQIENIGAKGICGSGIVDIMPQLFLAGIIEKTGRFKENLETPRFRVTDDGPEFVIAWANQTSIGEDVTIRQDDLRAIQLAKGAMYAGAKIMMRKYGAEKLDKVILAGAFGSYIDKNSAALLGLFPDCDLKNVYAVGNAAGDGARMALLNTDKRDEANAWARKVEYLELTLEQDFDKIFAQAMWLPHMKDKFPHLEDLLPKPE